MPRIKCILNPTADRGHAHYIEPELKQILDEQVKEASSNGTDYEVMWVRTEAPLHAIQLASTAEEEGFDAVVAVGGDGTVHEVVNGLMQIPQEKRPQLGVIPIGTGNDFAFNVGVPEDPKDAAHCVVGDLTRKVDIGSMTDGNGRSAFWDNTVGIGFNGVVSIASRQRTKMRGFLVYLVTVLETILFRPPALNTTYVFDDGEEALIPVSMFSICNGPREGGGFPVGPNAIMDDGLITYVVMRKMGRLNMLRFVPIIIAAAHLKFK